MSEASRWFVGEPVRNDEESRFLAGLRESAAKWSVEGLVPEHTSSFVGIDPLCVDLRVPGLPARYSILQVAYWSDHAGGPVLHGTWGDEYLLEDHDGNDPRDLTVAGVTGAPEQFAAWTAGWLLRQLHRPVVEERWMRHETVAAKTWRLADTGQVLGRKGQSARRILRRAPDRVITLRGASTLNPGGA